MTLFIVVQVLIVVGAVVTTFLRRKTGKKPLSNVTTVSIIALVTLLDLGSSHFTMYIKIFVALLVVLMWFMVYRYREQASVMGAVLAGLAAIMLLAG